jgi:phage gp46-like protein
MIKLVQTRPCEFDLVFDDPAMADEAAAIATVVYAVLFTDQEAPDSRVSDPWDRRGWYNDPQAGSGLWHVRRQPLTAAARQEAVSMVETALRARDPAISGLLVEAVDSPDPASDVSSVHLSISGISGGREFLLRVPLGETV